MSASRFASLPILLKSRKLRRVPMVPDGNCFYRAVAAVFYQDPNAHKTLRSHVMDYILRSEEVYGPLFTSPQRFRAVLTANKRLGVWNSDLADVVPLAMANLLNIRLEVFSILEDGEVIRYIFNDVGAPRVRLLYEEHHYDVLASGKN